MIIGDVIDGVTFLLACERHLNKYKWGMSLDIPHLFILLKRAFDYIPVSLILLT